MCLNMISWWYSTIDSGVFTIFLGIWNIIFQESFWGIKYFVLIKSLKKPRIENWWKIKINRYTDKKAIFNYGFGRNFSYLMLIERRFEWVYLRSELIILRAFFCNMNSWFNELLFWPQMVLAYFKWPSKIAW